MAEGEAAPVKLTPQQSDWWDARLDNWGIWYNSPDAGGRVKISSAYRLAGRGRMAESDGIPPEVGAALDTHRLWVQLTERRRRAIHYRYATTIGDGVAAHEMGVHRTTFLYFVTSAKEDLHDLHVEARRFHVKPIESARHSQHKG